MATPQFVRTAAELGCRINARSQNSATGYDGQKHSKRPENGAFRGGVPVERRLAGVPEGSATRTVLPERLERRILPSVVEPLLQRQETKTADAGLVHAARNLTTMKVALLAFAVFAVAQLPAKEHQSNRHQHSSQCPPTCVELGPPYAEILPPLQGPQDRDPIDY